MRATYFFQLILFVFITVIIFEIANYEARQFCLIFYLSMALQWNQIHYHCGDLLAYCTRPGR
jgi:hypothetical protein